MAIQAVPTFLQNASHSAAIFRQSASAAFASGGILALGEMALTQQGTPNMSVVLGAGRAKVSGTSVSPPAGMSFTTQAMYDTLNDAALTLTLTASNATNPRIDAAYVQVQDSFYSGATNTAISGVVAGVPAASPIAPAIPSNSTLVGYIAVGANVTSIVTANITSATSLARLITAMPQHAEWSFSRLAFPDGVSSAFNITAVTANTNDVTFVTVPGTGNTLTFTTSGIYAIDAVAILSVTSTGPMSIVCILAGAFAGEQFSPSGTNGMSLALANCRATAGQVAQLSVQKTTGGNADITMVVKVTRLGGF